MHSSVEGKVFDPSRHFIVCSNILGGCYGTTGPLSIDPATGERYGANFPLITIRDMVEVQYRLVRQLGIRRLENGDWGISWWNAGVRMGCFSWRND